MNKINRILNLVNPENPINPVKGLFDSLMTLPLPLPVLPRGSNFVRTS